VTEARPRWLVAAVCGLVVMVTWTLVVKYLAPLAWFVAERAAGRAPEAVPVMWDFWPLAHLALAALLWRRHPWALRVGIAVGAAEWLIVVLKLAVYLAEPARDFWSLLWASNKLYVLAYFTWLLALLLRRGRAALGPEGALLPAAP
jgi:hypothetical protein